MTADTPIGHACRMCGGAITSSTIFPSDLKARNWRHKVCRNAKSAPRSPEPTFSVNADSVIADFTVDPIPPPSPHVNPAPQSARGDGDVVNILKRTPTGRRILKEARDYPPDDDFEAQLMTYPEPPEED